MSVYEAFAAIYDDWSAHMTDDVAWYVELAREADGPVVELAVGNGRVAVPVAQALGRPIVGIDSSPSMLEQAREAGGDLLDLRLGDMRELELEEPAALVYCPARSLLHLPTWADRRRVFERVYATLLPGGRFAWNAFVFSPHVAAANDGKWDVQRGIRHRIDHVAADSRVDITLDSGGRVSLWWATRREWDGHVDEDSPEFVYVTRKPA